MNALFKLRETFNRFAYVFIFASICIGYFPSISRDFLCVRQSKQDHFFHHQMHQYSFNYAKAAFTIMILSYKIYKRVRYMCTNGLSDFTSSNHNSCGKLLFCVCSTYFHIWYLWKMAHLHVWSSHAYKQMN